MSGSLLTIGNLSDTFWVSHAIGLVLARGSVTVQNGKGGGYKTFVGGGGVSFSGKYIPTKKRGGEEFR